MNICMQVVTLSAWRLLKMSSQAWSLWLLALAHAHLTFVAACVQVVGAVLEPRAWPDTDIDFGALFIDNRIVGTGEQQSLMISSGL